MTTMDRLQLLRDHRALLLTCEAIGWLHMAGKARPNFLRTRQFRDWHDSLSPDWNSRLGWLRSTPSPLVWPDDLSGFLTGFDKLESEPNAVGLLQAAHGMASGIEKNHPRKASEYLAQKMEHIWLTTAFGHPVLNLLEQRPDVLVDDAWSQLEQQIGALLDDLATRSNSPNDLTAWRAWRDGAVGPKGWLRQAFTSTLAETRIPNNDVTLWDQSFVAAALFKAAVAGAVLTRTSFEWGNGVKSNTRWRVLTVGFGAEHYESRAVRIGDWTGTRAEIAGFFNDVCGLVEVDLAVGACVYRDERVLAFTFPGERIDARGSLDDASASNLRSVLEASVDELARKHLFETPPRVRLSASTRSFIAMSRELVEARRVLEVPVHRPWTIAADSSAGRHVCPVSLVRMGDERDRHTDQKQAVSKTCYDRRTGRRADWERSRGDTIWISEVADENDRVALLTFSLGLEGWLDGTLVDSLRAQSVAEWRANNASLVAIDTADPRTSLRSHVDGFIQAPRTDGKGRLRDPVFSSLNEGFAHERTLEDFFHKVVEDRASCPAWSSLDRASRAAWLSHQLFRKNASPGRVHRFWRTTQTFFQEALEEFRRYSSSDVRTVHRTHRLKLALAGDLNGMHAGEVYAGHLPVAPNAPFEILRRPNDYVTVCNLARVLGTSEDTSRLHDVIFEARSDDGTRRRLTIKKAEVAEEPLRSYTPLIVLEENPERFRVLVPLAWAEKCVDLVVCKWKAEMSRVWDRLPLRVGTIGFPRKMPFQAVIEAARNVEDELAAAQPEAWRVDGIELRSDAIALCLERPDRGREHLEVPTKLPDGQSNDVYYPNLAVANAVREVHDFDAPSPDGTSTVYRWARELRAGDEIVVTPSGIASVFLDSTARRFTPMRVDALAAWDLQRKVWNFVSLCAPSLGAALAVEQSLREARERWTDVDGALDEGAWRAWTHAVLVNEWSTKGEAAQELKAAAQSGLLERVLSWNLHVLKRTLGEKR